MATYTRTIGRQITNALPAWRNTMSATNTLYEVGDAPTVLSSKIVWPAAGANNFQFNGGGDSNAIYLHAAYGGSVFVSELGAYGTMIFGRTGEATIDSQLTKFTLSDNAPTWDFYQQPTYPISSAQATSMNADWYYSEADFAALPANQKGAESFFASTWNGTFPAGFSNWIIRRKYANGGVTGVPNFFRYGMPAYIPSSMTGTGVGAIIVNQRGTIYGPFSQGPIPGGDTASRWFADVWPSGRQKHYLWAMNVQTKAWQRLSAEIPDWTGYGGYIEHPYSCVDAANKRVYYTTFNGSSYALYYASFSSGLAGMTISGPTNLSDLAGGPATSQASNSVLCVPQSGALAGKRLWFLREGGTANALLIDINANTLRRLAITGLPSTSEWWGWAYDAASNRVYITTKNASFGMRSYRFTIPDNYTSAAAYSVSMQQVALNGIALESSADSSPWLYGERTRYHEGLGVILLTQRYGKMLAYRPA